MHQPIIVHMDTIGVDRYLGTEADDETLKFALAAYGYLLKTPPYGVLRRHSFCAFANVIEAHYDMAEGRNAEVVHTLRRLERFNNPSPQDGVNHCMQVCGGGICGVGPVCQFGIDPSTGHPVNGEAHEAQKA